MGAVAGTGYQHTLSDLRKHIYAGLMQDESNSHFTKARVNLWINEVFDKMRLRRLYSLSVDVFTTSADQQTWIPPSDVWRIVDITYDLGGADRALRQIGHDEMNEVTGDDWDSSSGEPLCWYTDGVKIWFDTKMPVGKNVQFWYWERRQEITTDAELSGFYKVMLPVIVSGVLAQAMWSDGKMNKYVTAKQEFDEYAAEAIAYIATLHPTGGVVQDSVGWN
jgi:hypothetical protein